MDDRSTPTLVPAYTVVLGANGVLILLSALFLFSFANLPHILETSRWVYEFSARSGVVLAAVAGLVVLLRVRQSRFAPTATVLFSVFLAIYFPFGTASLIYWLASVRKRERGQRGV